MKAAVDVQRRLGFAVGVQAPGRVQAGVEVQAGADIVGYQDVVGRDHALVDHPDGKADRIARFDLEGLAVADQFDQCKVEDLNGNGCLVMVVFVLALHSVAPDLVILEVRVVVVFIRC